MVATESGENIQHIIIIKYLLYQLGDLQTTSVELLLLLCVLHVVLCLAS